MAAQETVIKKIDEIKYGLMSPQYIKKLATVEVITPELYDVDGYPIEKGLIDLSMGVVDPGLRCKTCYDDVKKCPGHFGYTTLAKPVLHPIFINELHSFLHVFCKFCGRAVIPQNLIDKAKQRIEELKKHKNTDALIRFKKEVLTLAKKKAKCPHCEQKQPDIKLEKPYVFYEGGKRLWPNEIRERLEKIPDVDLPILGWDAKENRPEWMILTLLLIPPVSVRPSIVLISGERSEDDLTHKLSDIIRVNQRLVENLNGGAPQIIVEDLHDLLQYHVATFYDNTLPNIPVASHRSGRPLKTLAERLKGKEGRFRHNLAGKRVNFSARSVITPDPYISINELGVPQYVAMELTLPERVTEWNLDYLKALVEKGPEIYPGANYVFDLDEKRLRITPQSKDLILQSIQPGWVVERHLRDSDIVIFNRQPSLHRLSMMAHYVKILPGRTFKVSPFVTIPYNADFDGDEMNLHLPQTEEARAETQILMSVDKNIITPRYGSNIIGSNQDPILGIYILTKDLSFNYKQAADLLLSAGLSIPEEFQNKSKISGKELFSTILPQDLDFEDEKYNVKIKKGKLIQGVINNSFIGQEGGSLTHQIYLKYGIQRVEQFINEVNKLGLEVANKNSYTMSFDDLDIPSKLKEDMKRRMSEATEKVQDVVRRFKRGQIKPLPGKTVEETKEVEVLQILNSLRTDIEKMIAKTLKEDRGIIKLIFSGTEGKILNLTQMIGLVGQNTLRGHRILHGYKDRTLPVFEKGDQGVQAGGFAKNGYGDGLSPTELFFNAVVGRDALMDTAMRTPNSGYLNRRLIYSMQDLKVHYDATVRDANQNIIQFNFGGDNVDVSKSSSGKEKITGGKIQTYNENKPWLEVDVSEEIQLDPGETIGLVSAQSISEPGTQLTMRTFHFVGVTELNVTLGLPRIIEIFDARKIPKTPLTHIYLKPPHNRLEEDAEKLAKKIEEVRLPKISDEISINFTDIKVIAKLNTNLLEKHSITNEQIIASAKKSIKDAEIDIRGHILEAKIKESDVKRLFRIKYLMENLLVGGVKSITYVLPVKKENEYLLQCYGTNLKDILQLEEVDPTRTYSNDLYEVAENLGIEAARELVIREVLLVLKEQGFEVDERHIALVSDLMTMSGRVKGVTRHGIITEKSSVLARASYEIPIKHLTDAAIVSESNEVNGVIDNVMINQPAPVGTALPGLAVKLKDELAHHVRKEKK